MWDRSELVMTGAERELQDALLALERVLGSPELRDDVRPALRVARTVLRDALAVHERRNG